MTRCPTPRRSRQALLLHIEALESRLAEAERLLVMAQRYVKYGAGFGMSLGGMTAAGVAQAIDRFLAAQPEQRSCVYPECVSTDRHWHGPFPGGYENPANPEGPPVEFTTEPAPGVRDYNGALLSPAAESKRDRRWRTS